MEQYFSGYFGTDFVFLEVATIKIRQNIMPMLHFDSLAQ